MGTGYTRNDTSNNIANGNVIDADDLDGEFNALESAFDSSTGHTHDGTSAEGGAISVTGPNQEYLSDATALYPKTDDTYDLGKTGSEWKDLYIDGVANIDSLVVTGNIAVDGTVDGRDVAADGTKLDGIEASADVTDTANVTAAGALMDSELTDIVAVKALDQGVATTDSPTFAETTITGDLTVDTDTLFVDAGNNRVGIGTTTPSAPLEIEGAFNTALFINDTGGNIDDIILADTSGSVRLRNSAGAFQIYSGGDAASNNATNSTQSFRVNSTGDVDFLEDDGATVGVRWDSSESRLGVGTTSPSQDLHILRTSGDAGLRVDANAGDANIFVASEDTGLSQIFFGDNSAFNSGFIQYTHTNDNFVYRSSNDHIFQSGSTEILRIDSSGNVGIGTDAPAHQLEVENSGGNAIISATSSTTGTSQLRLGDTDNTGAGRVDYDNSDNTMSLVTGGTERVSVSSSGITVDGTVDATDFTGDGSTLTGVALPKTEVSEVATTSGTSVDIITGIPSGVNSIELYFYDISISAADYIVIQLGTTASYNTSGYNGYTARGAGGATLTSGMPVIFSNADTASANKPGLMRLHRVPGTNKWVAGSEAGYTTSTGSIDLGAQLTRLRVTTNGGTATFDNGGISARYS